MNGQAESQVFLITVPVRYVIAILSLGFLAAFAWVSQYVWLPDVIFAKSKIVATCSLPNGDRLEVYQYWNQSDFYNLNLRVFRVNGQSYSCVIDPDCNKVWRCEVKLNKTTAQAVIVSGRETWAHYHWSSGTLTLANGSQRLL